MNRPLDEYIPSMFARRLLMLAGVMGVVLLALAARLSALTLLDPEAHRLRASEVLSQRRVVPTSRGRILDRHGRVLATSRPGYDLAVRYPVISGAWAHQQARALAAREHRAIWAEMTELEREALSLQREPEVQQRVEELWRALQEAGGIDRSELDRRLDAVKQRVQTVASAVWLRRLEQKSEAGDTEVDFAQVAEPVGEHAAAHALVSDVEAAAIPQLRALIAQGKQDRQSIWRQVELVPAKVREYPLETMTVVVDRSTFPSPLRSDKPAEVTVRGVGLHAVGWLRPAYGDDVEGRPLRLPPEGADADDAAGYDLGGYLPGDEVGRAGVEAAMEPMLRGTRGVLTEFLDTRTQRRIEPQPGQDVQLTLDINLQARVQAVMDPLDSRMGLMQTQPWHARDVPDGLVGHPLNGAALVLDVASGHVLAAVSVPWFSLGSLRSSPREIYGDEVNRPELFRVTGGSLGGVYQPGSTLKPFVLAAAITDRRVGHDELVDCHGHLDPDVRDRFRCWIFNQFDGATHGPLGGAEAIARSCNIYFYTLGRRLGSASLVDWLGRFGMGASTGCGLSEAAGDLPDLSAPDSPALSKAAATLMGIGQGPVGWTPLQAANAYAALARGGYLTSPSFIISPQRDDGRRLSRDLGLDPRAVDIALQGLDEATNERHGTGHHLALLNGEAIFNVPGVRVMGKSGTATAAPQRVDSDGDGRITRRDEVVRRGDHAWFVGLVQKPRSPRPDYVIVVVVEYAGSGGAVSGPIANQVLHAMRAEGYL